MSFDIPGVSKMLPGNSGTIEEGQTRKTGRDILVIAGMAVVAFLLENAGIISEAFAIDQETIISGASIVAALFGWRTFRP